MTGEEFIQHLNRESKITIITHRQPDGDALASAWALLKLFGDRAEFVISSKIPAVFADFLPDLRVASHFPANPGAVLILDCANFSRTDYERELRSLVAHKKPVYCLDHHKVSLPRGVEKAWIDPGAASTTELIWNIFQIGQKPIRGKLATVLLLGLYTDTGGFCHPNTSGRTLKLVSQMLKNGANLNALTATLSPRRTLAKTRLWGAVMTNLKVDGQGVAAIYLTRKKLVEIGATRDDLMGLANVLAGLKEARLGLVAVEDEEEGSWQISIRTQKEDINVGKVANAYGGKGTPRAAGFTVKKSAFSGKINLR